MRPWTLLPLDPTDTPACWTCAERSGNRSSRPSRGTTTPRRDRVTPVRRGATTTAVNRVRSTAALPGRAARKRPAARAKMGSRPACGAARPRSLGWRHRAPPGARGPTRCGAARLWAGCSTRCTVEVGSAAPGAVAGEHRSVAGWSARRGGRARPGSRLGAARCTDRAASASRPGRGRSSRGERGRHRTVECPRAATAALGVRWWTGGRADGWASRTFCWGWRSG